MRHNRIWWWYLYSFRMWFERIWFCHHNARVLVGLEDRLSCVLSHATNCLSKPYYDLPTMYQAINEHIAECCDEAVEDYKREYECNCESKFL